MESYSKEFKERAVARMRDGTSTIREVEEEFGVCNATLYNWERDIKGVPRSNSPRNKEKNGWNSETKYNAVIATSVMTEYEKSEYCRSKGIYIEQLKEWEEACKNANAEHANMQQDLREELRKEKQSKVALEKELRRKEKALAETAALLVLRKKAEAIWGDPEDE